MASQRLPTVCLYLTVCFQTHIFDRPVQSETSPGCVEAYAYHAQGGKGHTWCWCSSEGNLYNTQFAVPLRISVLLLGDGRMCCFWIFFDFQKKRKTENWHQNRRWSCEWLFQPYDPFATRRILAVSTSWPMRRMRRRIRQLALVDTDIDWFFDGSEDGLRGTLHISVRLYISLMNNMIPYSKGTLMEHPQSSNLCWDQFISAPSDLQMRKTSNQFFQHKHPCRSEMVFGGRGCGWTNKHVYVDLYLFFIYSLMASKMFEFSLLKTHLMYSKTIDLHVIHIPIFWVNESSTCFWSHRFQACTTSVFCNCGFCLEPGRR